MKRLDGRPYNGTHTIFTMDYLCNAELTEQDLNVVFESGNFTLSVIVGMHRYIGDKRTAKQIIDSCKKDEDWFNNKSWSLESFKNFCAQLSKAYKNVWYYSDIKSKFLADMWLNNFGFRIDKNMK